MELVHESLQHSIWCSSMSHIPEMWKSLDFGQDKTRNFKTSLWSAVFTIYCSGFLPACCKPRCSSLYSMCEAAVEMAMQVKFVQNTAQLIPLKPSAGRWRAAFHYVPAFSSSGNGVTCAAVNSQVDLSFISQDVKEVFISIFFLHSISMYSELTDVFAPFNVCISPKDASGWRIWRAIQEGRL